VSGYNAEIIAVGSELLTASKLDTNSLWLTDQLNALGVEVVQKGVVGDDRARLTDAIRGALARAGIVVVTGGLGPTEDDLTRDAAAAALGRGQTFRQDLCDIIAARFRRMNRKMAGINRRQAFVVDGAEALPNDRGTAPGQWIEEIGRVLMLLPGPPRELTSMFEQHCVPRLIRMLPPAVIRTRFYRISCMPEGDVDQLISPVYARYTNPVTTILAAAGDIQVHLRARCATAEEAEALLDEVGPQLESLLGERCYTRTGEPLESVVGERLRSRGETLSLAESATGGMLAERITSVPGASDYFKGGFLTYTDETKAVLLGVDPAILREHTAVSDAAAKAMAAGARERTNSTYALSVTGYAGPEGGTEQNPAGTMFVGVATPDGVSAKRYQFVGDRARVRALTVVWALDLLRCRLAT
jgi:nicotinamide-nucleotide amidase